MHPSDDQCQVWVDADFSGNWNREESMEDPDTARSRTGYVVRFLGCPIMWKSQLQTEIALSPCEAEYIALSQALRKVIPVMHLIQEMKRYNYHNTPSVPKVQCTLFEDNNIKYHHFRTHVAAGTIDLQAIRSVDQPADIFTKPLTESVFALHRQAIMGWGHAPTGKDQARCLVTTCLPLPTSRNATAMAGSLSLPASLRGSAGILLGLDRPAVSCLSILPSTEGLGSTFYQRVLCNVLFLMTRCKLGSSSPCIYELNRNVIVVLV
jgi:hypothetical protein